MNNEIKKMLELHIKNDIDLLPKNQQKVLDYITNLQKENEKIRKDIRKDLIDNIKKDIINYGLTLDAEEKHIVNKVLIIIENHYFK